MQIVYLWKTLLEFNAYKIKYTKFYPEFIYSSVSMFGLQKPTYLCTAEVRESCRPLFLTFTRIFIKESVCLIIE